MNPEEEAVLDAAWSRRSTHIDFVKCPTGAKTFSLNAEIHITFAEEADVAPRWPSCCTSRYSANVPDEPEGDEATVVVNADPYVRQSERAPLKRVSATALWTALSDSDEMNVTKITVRQGAKQIPPESGEWIIPFDCEGGVLDFSEDEDIELLGARGRHHRR